MTHSRSSRSLFIGTIAILSLLLFVIPALAATTTFSGTFSGNTATGWCSAWPGNSQGPFQVSAAGLVTIEITSYGGGTDMAAYIVSAADPNTVVGGIAYASGPTSNTANLTAGQPYYLVTCENAGAPTGNSYSVTITGSLGSASVGKAAPAVTVVAPPDARLNWQFGDLGAVLYRSSDNGEPAIDVYCYDGEQGELGLRVSEANMRNGMSTDGCNVTFYILPEGGYQFNIYADGKLDEIECADFTCANPVRRHYDPSE